MRFLSYTLPLVLVAACGVAACGGAQTSPGAPRESSDAVRPGAPGVPWSGKTRAQRQDWMGLEVLPAMKQVFLGFDAKGFEDFKCQTCHGDDMKAVDFKMPNTLYSLPKEDTLNAALDYDADTTKFMKDVVVPQMAKLLDQPVYDPATGMGVGCFTCHPAE